MGIGKLQKKLNNLLYGHGVNSLHQIVSTATRYFVNRTYLPSLFKESCIRKFSRHFFCLITENRSTQKYPDLLSNTFTRLKVVACHRLGIYCIIIKRTKMRFTEKLFRAGNKSYSSYKILKLKNQMFTTKKKKEKGDFGVFRKITAEK